MAAYRIWQTLDRVPPIDAESNDGLKPPLSSVRGRIEFRNVRRGGGRRVEFRNVRRGGGRGGGPVNYDASSATPLAFPFLPSPSASALPRCSFAYPSRPEQLVLRDFSLVVEPGQTVALVGPSGSGKSTIVQLLQRNYLPLSGEILLDGVPIKDWNVRHLRDAMGLVSQVRGWGWGGRGVQCRDAMGLVSQVRGWGGEGGECSVATPWASCRR